jgi:hypothetical protein
MNLRIDLNEPRIREKVTSDRFGRLVSLEWKRLLDPYTPRDTGVLMGVTGQTVDVKPFKLHYKVPYAEAVYYNRRGVEFITQGSGRNPYATDHWDIKAEQAGQKDKLYRTLNDALQSGQF